jgi:putative DNA primase/helicase
LRHQKYSTPEPDVLLERLSNVRLTGRDSWTATCPAHGTGRNRALSVTVEDEKLLLHCFAGCPAEAVLAAVGLAWPDLYGRAGLRHRAKYTITTTTPEFSGLNAEKWGRWWDAAKPHHPLLGRYLQARGLSITPPPTLRLALWGEQPVMLARVEGLQGLVGMHLTFLKPDGSGRLEKKLAAGSKPLGAAIRLYPFEAGKPLALAEGIETALAVHQAAGWAVWACVSAGGLAAVELPAGAREVVIAADHDKAGLEAAHALARRLLSEGRKVRLATPPREGQDWLDVVGGVA